MSEHLPFPACLTAAGIAFRTEEPMAAHTSFRIGGAAEYFLLPDSTAQLITAIRCCQETSIPYAVMGNGSNLLVSDRGLTGAVIACTPAFGKITRTDHTLTAEAGATLAQLCRFAEAEGLSGLEFAYGIPGSVGGAIFMNAGAYGGEMTDVVTEVSYLDPQNTLRHCDHDAAAFSYRNSRFQREKLIVCGATVALQPAEPAAISAKMAEILARRREKQPLEYPSAGSAFRRPPNGFAAALIDQCGLKGYAVGGAEVSRKHAGFVINRGEATCAEVRQLLSEVAAMVQEKTGISLETEIRDWGE